jgi:hypothetical protein
MSDSLYSQCQRNKMYSKLLIVFSATIIACASALAQTPTPVVSADPLEDVPTADPGDLYAFYDFSWRLFIALNWPAQKGAAGRGLPAAGRGLPDYNKTIGDPGPRVWTTWKSRYEIFRSNGAVPFPWASYEGQNPCGQGFRNDVLTLSSFSPFADFNQTFPFANPLVAQNHSYVRYEVRANEREFDSIVGNNWYIESNLPNSQTAVPFNTGSTTVKAAWRILKKGEDGSRYYVVPGAQVFDGKKCILQDVALVGLHIVTKTKTRPQWIWSTFEHVDNVPGITTEPKPPQNVKFSFNNANGPSGLDPAKPPPPVTQENFQTNPSPMQVVREQRILHQAMDVNRAYWQSKGIKHTIWQNYMLVLTQWPTMVTPAGPGYGGEPFPIQGSNLSNTTMETYLQDGHIQHRYRNCMACHAGANESGRDFVWFVTFDAYRPGVRAPGDLFRTKAFHGHSHDTGILSRDPVIQSLIKIFQAAEQK